MLHYIDLIGTFVFAISGALAGAKRVGQARQWAINHPDDYAKVYAELTRLPLATAKSIADRTSKGAHAVSQEDINALQPVADLFYQLKILPNKVEVNSLVDSTLAVNQ